MTGINEVAKQIHENAVDHGWWDEERGFPEVLALIDYCGYAEIDIDTAISQKHEYNKSRPYRHGGKKC